MHRTVCSGKSLTSQQENYEKLMSVLNSSRERKRERLEDSPTKGDNNNKHQGDSNNTQQDTRITGTHTQQIDLSISICIKLEVEC